MKTLWDPREYYKDPDVAESYDRTRFNSLAGRTFSHMEQRTLVKAFENIPAGAEVLDVPCGTGRLAVALLKAGYRVTGVDISGAMLEKASQRLAHFGGRFSCIVSDIMSLRTPDKPFAGAVCARILMHLPFSSQVEFLRAVARQTDGPIVFNQSYDSNYQRARRRIKSFLGHRAPAAHPLKELEIKQLLAESGLQEVRRLRVAPLLSEAFFLIATKKRG